MVKKAKNENLEKIKSNLLKLQTKSLALTWIEKIGALYHVNSQRTVHVRESEEFEKYDQELGQLLSDFFSTASKQVADKALPSHCKKVLKSLEAHKKGLLVFKDHPEIPMDNNKAEQSLRSPVVGRKNYYGSGSRKMGNFAVIMFSIIHTLLLWKINPKEWLLWYFSSCLDGTPQSIEEFLPWNMSKEKLKEFHLSDTEKPFIDTS